LITTPKVEAAMRAVDRGFYAIHDPYVDAPSSIGYGATISAPHMHAHCLEVLRDHLIPGAKILDVGSGSGYLAAVMATMVTNSGSVLGIDLIPELVEQSIANVKKANPQLLNEGLTLKVGDGWQEMKAEFDAIHVGAAAATVPAALVKMLKPGGDMVIPVGTTSQDLVLIHKSDTGQVTQRTLMGVRYVPLVNRNE